MMAQTKELACRCGLGELSVRVNATEGVGLVTCGAGHHSFLLDSRDVWTDVIQQGRPRELRCRCKGRTFSLAVDYAFREDTRKVRSVAVRALCSTCKAERPVFDAEIDYEPTDELVDRPLDPVENPWTKARRVELTALWRPEDVERLLRFVGSLSESQIHFAAWRSTPRLVDAEEASRLVASARRENRIYDLLFACVSLSVPPDPRNAWKHLPVVQLRSPTRMNYRTGSADLYYVTYAIEDVVGAKAIPRSTDFTTFAGRIRSWLKSEFVSERGKNAVDNPSEYQRVRGG